jgi:hypothetical protein
MTHEPGPNVSMSGSNQHVMQINLRRMERSDFTELPSATSKPKGGGPGRQEGAAVERCGALLVPLFEGKPPVTCINALLGFLARQL